MSTPTVGEAVLHALWLGGPTVLLPAVAAWWAWRRPTRGRAGLTTVACLVGALVVLNLRPSENVPSDPGLELRWRLFSLLPFLLGAAAFVWLGQSLRPMPLLPHVALALNLGALALTLFVLVHMHVTSAADCTQAMRSPGAPVPPGC